MKSIERVLIHPFVASYVADLAVVWAEWARRPSTYIIKNHNIVGLGDVRYVNLVNYALMIGGQSAVVCIPAHILALTTHPRVRNKEVSLLVSQRATMSDPQLLSDMVQRFAAAYPIHIELVD